MSENKNNTITLIYCGREFHHYTNNGNAVHRYFFIDKQYTFYEFFDNGGYHVESILSGCKLGTSVNVTWKRYGQTWKKIILDVSDAIADPYKNFKA
jgi:hypothetical protein